MGITSNSFPVCIDIVTGKKEEEEEQRVETCCVKVDAPLYSRNGTPFPPAYAHLTRVGDLLDFVCLHLCLPMLVMRQLNAMHQTLAETRLVPAPILNSLFDISWEEVPRDAQWLVHEHTPRAPKSKASRIVLVLRRGDTRLTLEIAPNLVLVMHAPVVLLSSTTTKTTKTHTQKKRLPIEGTGAFVQAASSSSSSSSSYPKLVLPLAKNIATTTTAAAVDTTFFRGVSRTANQVQSGGGSRGIPNRFDSADEEEEDDDEEDRPPAATSIITKTRKFEDEPPTPILQSGTEPFDKEKEPYESRTAYLEYGFIKHDHTPSATAMHDKPAKQIHPDVQVAMQAIMLALQPTAD